MPSVESAYDAYIVALGRYPQTAADLVDFTKNDRRFPILTLREARRLILDHDDREMQNPQRPLHQQRSSLTPNSSLTLNSKLQYRQRKRPSSSQSMSGLKIN